MTSWNYATLFEAIAGVQPNAPALIQGERTISWQVFEERTRSLATWLWELGAVHQDKVALYLYNSPEYMEAAVAAFRVGLVPVNTNYRYGRHELLYLWDNADAIAVVFHGSFTETIDMLRHDATKIRSWVWVDDGSGPCPDWATPYETTMATLPERLPEGTKQTPDDLLMMYTGGTTGMPKGVMWRQDDILCRMNSRGFRRWDLEAGMEVAVATLAAEGEGNRMLPACPLMHGTGMFTALEVLVEGGSIVLLEDRKFDAVGLAAAIDEHGVNMVVIVGDPFARPLLDVFNAEPERFHFDSLFSIVSSGAMWSEEVKLGLLEHFPTLLLVDTFGSSEAIGIGSSVSKAGSSKKTGAFSISNEVRVLDEHDQPITPGSDEIGALALGGRNPLGYYKDAAKSAATFRMIEGQRFSVPGDFAKVAIDGSIQLLGRGSQCINTAGEKVFPEEVEETLKRHPSVVDACVVGVPDSRFGERVVAAVELRDGATFDESELIAHTKDQLAHYKAPRHIRVVATLGRAANGKMDYARHKSEAADWFEGLSS